MNGNETNPMCAVVVAGGRENPGRSLLGGGDQVRAWALVVTRDAVYLQSPAVVIPEFQQGDRQRPERFGQFDGPTFWRLGSLHLRDSLL